MMKPSRPEVFFGGMAVACVVACVAVFLWKKWPAPATFGTKGEWVGALATLAAALTAVAIAFWSHRRNKIDSMMEGAFEIVAADYVIRQIKGQADLFRLRLANYVAQLTNLDERLARYDQSVSDAQADQVEHPSNAAASFDRYVEAERMRERLEHQKDEHSAKAIQEFTGYVEALQTQTTTLSHVKMAAFDPAIGLAVVKVKALLRRSEGLVKLAATAPALLESLQEVLELLTTVEGGVHAAERHIKRIAVGQ